MSNKLHLHHQWRLIVFLGSLLLACRVSSIQITIGANHYLHLNIERIATSANSQHILYRISIPQAAPPAEDVAGLLLPGYTAQISEHQQDTNTSAEAATASQATSSHHSFQETEQLFAQIASSLSSAGSSNYIDVTFTIPTSAGTTTNLLTLNEQSHTFPITYLSVFDGSFMLFESAFSPVIHLENEDIAHPVWMYPIIQNHAFLSMIYQTLHAHLTQLSVPDLSQNNISIIPQRFEPKIISHHSQILITSSVTSAPVLEITPTALSLLEDQPHPVGSASDSDSSDSGDNDPEVAYYPQREQERLERHLHDEKKKNAERLIIDLPAAPESDFDDPDTDDSGVGY